MTKNRQVWGAVFLCALFKENVDREHSFIHKYAFTVTFGAVYQYLASEIQCLYILQALALVTIPRHLETVGTGLTEFSACVDGLKVTALAG